MKSLNCDSVAESIEHVAAARNRHSNRGAFCDMRRFDVFQEIMAYVCAQSKYYRVQSKYYQYYAH